MSWGERERRKRAGKRIWRQSYDFVSIRLKLNQTKRWAAVVDGVSRFDVKWTWVGSLLQRTHHVSTSIDWKTQRFKAMQLETQCPHSWPSKEFLLLHVIHLERRMSHREGGCLSQSFILFMQQKSAESTESQWTRTEAEWLPLQSAIDFSSDLLPQTQSLSLRIASLKRVWFTRSLNFQIKFPCASRRCCLKVNSKYWSITLPNWYSCAATCPLT